jgi:hypothetical protein
MLESLKCDEYSKDSLIKERLVTKINLASLYRSKKAFKEAEAHLEVVSARLAIFGTPYHRDVLSAQNNLAFVKVDLNYADEALQIFVVEVGPVF